MSHSETYIDGVHYPSVTTILGSRPKPWLDEWRDKWGILAERKTAVAKKVGTAFHEGIEGLVWNKLVHAKTQRIHNMLERVVVWLGESGFKPMHTELKVISHKYKYSGTLDAVGTVIVEGKVTPVLVDWKSSSGIYEDMPLQLVAYAQAYFERFQIWLDVGIIVLVKKDKPKHKLIVKEYVLDKKLLRQFLKRLEEYNQERVKVKP